jgi:ribose transport system substrate-binding protein
MRLTGKRWLSLAAVAAASATLAACSSSSSPSASATSSSTSSSTSSGSSAGVAKAQQMVAQYEAATTTYPVPTASISGLSKLSGRTVYYIPLTEDIPGFAITAAAMKVALAKVGVKFQECNGDANPTAISACITQAEGASAAGIILDSIPELMVPNAVSGAEGKNIPVIIADQYPASSTSNTDKLTYVEGAVTQPTQIAWWIIDSTSGKANFIIGQEDDSPSSEQYVQNSLAVYKQYCPDCTYTVKAITASMTAQEETSSVTSNLQADPSATLYYTEFEDSLQNTIAGIQAAGKTSSVGVAVAGGSTDGLGLLSSGQDNVKAVVVVDQAYAGWALSDEILRMATGTAPASEPFPSRLFTSSNIKSIQVTAAAEDDGAWFGNDSYQAQFEKLWGLG